MSKIRDSRYYAYIKTCSYKRVVDSFVQENQLIQLDAIRNKQSDNLKHPQPVRYLSHCERSIRDLDLNYNVRKHGPFSKSSVKSFLSQTGCRDFWINSMTVLVNDDGVRKEAVELLADAGIPRDSILAGETYAARFEKTPCRRYSNEEKAPQWTQDVMALRTEEEKELGFEPGVLDLTWILPFDIWRDIQGKTRISRAFDREVERLKEALNVHNEASFSRGKVVNAVLPKTCGLIGGRTEALTGKDTWVIVGID